MEFSLIRSATVRTLRIFRPIPQCTPKGKNMRSKKLFTAMIAIVAIACSHAHAQSGSRGALSSPIQAPSVFQSVPNSFGSAIPAQQFGSSVFPTQQFGSPTFQSPQFGGFSSSPDVYSSVVAPSNSFGPATIGDLGSSQGCCNQAPVPTAIPNLAPVTSCCGKLGPLGVPPLLTPARTYRPPIGRQVGRPLFGKWQGY